MQSYYLCRLQRCAVLMPVIFWGGGKSIVNYTFTDYLLCFWDMSLINPSAPDHPVCFQFWFIRDLMVTTLLTPFIYYGIKKIKGWFIVLLFLIYSLFSVTLFSGFSWVALFYFSVGAYLSLNGGKMPVISNRLIALGCYLILTIVEIYAVGFKYYDILHKLVIIVGVFCTISIMQITPLLQDKLNKDILLRSSFFIYAYHGFTIAGLRKILFILVPPHNNVMLIAHYLICPAIVILIGIGLNTIMSKFLPKVTKVMCGGR